MKRQERLSSLQSVGSDKHCENGTDGNTCTMAMQPPLKSCRVGVTYMSVSHSGTQPMSKDYSSQNGLTDSVERPRLDSTMSEGEQVNVFSVDEVSDILIQKKLFQLLFTSRQINFGFIFHFQL